MILIIILIVLFIISILMNILFLKKVNNQSNIINRQNEAIEKASQNMKHLVDYQDIIQNIQKDHTEVYNQIKEASTNEEVNDIIRNLIDINNKHVQNGT